MFSCIDEFTANLIAREDKTVFVWLQTDNKEIVFANGIRIIQVLLGAMANATVREIKVRPHYADGEDEEWTSAQILCAYKVTVQFANVEA